MSVKYAQTGIRNVTIEFSNAWNTADGSETAQVATPVDAFKAAIAKVEELEYEFDKLGAAGVPDLTDAVILTRGASNQNYYKFTVTTVMANAQYEFLFVETVAPETL